MEFERELRERLYQQGLEEIGRTFQNRFRQKLTTWNFQDVKSKIVGAYSIYISNTAKGKTREQLHELYESFEQSMSEDVLDVMKEDIELDEREKAYIMYSELKEYGRRRKSS